MADLFKSKENEFYIALKEHRYYFSGEEILGDVVLDLKKSTKTNNIKISLEGFAEIGGRKFTIYTDTIYVAETEEKSYYLDAFTHRFPFTMNIPSYSEFKIPSTLEIPNLLKVTYKLTAIHNRPFVIEKFCSTATEEVPILEDINVESDGLNEPYEQVRELALTGETRTVRVEISVEKRAAVKGDTIPIKITIHHIGVMVKDKAIKLQLMRCVYYGKNKNELFGPKVLSETTGNIEISGPTSFTKSFNFKLPIPSAVSCPTVDDSCDLFKIEYNIRAVINLNEESPLRQEDPNDVVSFNIPFTVGTHPKPTFNIDDDYDDEEDEILVQQMTESSIHNSSEFDRVFENMKHVESNSAEVLNTKNEDEKHIEVDNENDAKKDTENDAKKDTENDAKKDTENDAEKDTENDDEKDTESDDEKDTENDDEKDTENDDEKDTANDVPENLNKPDELDENENQEHEYRNIKYETSKIESPTQEQESSSVEHSSPPITTVHRQESMRWVPSPTYSTPPTISTTPAAPDYSQYRKPFPVPTPLPSYSTPIVSHSTAPQMAFPLPYASNSTSTFQPGHRSSSSHPEPPVHLNMPMPSSGQYNHHPYNSTHTYYGANNYTAPNQGYNSHQIYGGYTPTHYNQGYNHPVQQNISFPTPHVSYSQPTAHNTYSS